MLLTVETAISGGVLLLGRDGVLRDLSALSRHYRQLAVTRPALVTIGRFLATQRVERVRWLFDRPISNSGRLRGLALELARDNGWPWTAELDDDPDGALVACGGLVATADSAVLEGCVGWVNLVREIVEATCDGAWVVDLSTGSS